MAQDPQSNGQTFAPSRPIHTIGFNVKSPTVTATCSGIYELVTKTYANGHLMDETFKDYEVSPEQAGYTAPTPPTPTPPIQVIIQPPPSTQNSGGAPDVWISQ